MGAKRILTGLLLGITASVLIVTSSSAVEGYGSEDGTSEVPHSRVSSSVINIDAPRLIGGNVWHDENLNGVLDAGADGAPVVGESVSLWTLQDDAWVRGFDARGLSETRTDENGNFSFLVPVTSTDPEDRDSMGLIKWRVSAGKGTGPLPDLQPCKPVTDENEVIMLCDMSNIGEFMKPLQFIGSFSIADNISDNSHTDDTDLQLPGHHDFVEPGAERGETALTRQALDENIPAVTVAELPPVQSEQLLPILGICAVALVCSGAIVYTTRKRSYI